MSIEYVKSLNLFGTEIALIPAIPGIGTPEGKIPKETGLLYLDTSSGNLWKCVGDAWIAGEGSVEIDLSNYYTKEEINQLAEELVAGLDYPSKAEVWDDAIKAAEFVVSREIGDISSALDELHTYAETLKGGEAG